MCNIFSEIVCKEFYLMGNNTDMARFSRKTVPAFCLFLLLAALFAASAQAHRVNLFAFVEGDTIYTESYFSKKKRVHGGRIEVKVATTGDVLLTGRTDDSGGFSFPVPERAARHGLDVIVVLDASEGHRAEWTVRADEFAHLTEALLRTGGEARKTVPAETPPAAKAVPAERKTAPQPRSDEIATPALRAAERDEILNAIDELGTKVHVLNRLVMEMEQGGPGVTEVVGGIGYIIGLVGLAAWFQSRRRTGEKQDS